MVRNLRMLSGTVLFVFVTLHLLNMAFGLISIDAVETARTYLTAPWSFGPVFALLLLSMIVHMVLGLHSLYRRSTLRMSGYDLSQLIFGLLIMPLLASHIVGIWATKNLFDADPTYRLILSVFWVSSPLEGLRQVFVVVVVWVHGIIGIFSWMRIKPWWERVSWFIYPFIVAVPVVALLGFVDAGNQVIAEAEQAAEAGMEASEAYDAQPNAYGAATEPEEELSEEERVAEEKAAEERRAANQANLALTYRILWIVLTIYAAMVAITLLLRAWRLRTRSQRMAIINYVDGPTVEARVGTSLLEISRLNDLPHANLCRGRGRCGTCRVRVVEAQNDLNNPSSIELATLARLGSPPDVRLACQICPQAGSLTVERLVSPDIAPRDMVLNQKAEARSRIASGSVAETADV